MEHNLRRWIQLVEHGRVSLSETVAVDTPQFRAWFGASKVVDSQGNPLPAYHGTGRGDRVGTRFRKARATAGPMAYFTDSPEIASGYAAGKADTSLEDGGNYEDWITVTIDNKTKMRLDRSWFFLSSAEQAEISALAPRVTRDDEDNIVLSNDPSQDGPGNYSRTLRDSRGNPLMALIESWLISGMLFGDEDRFGEVLKLVGFKRKFWIFDPRSTMPFVYQVFLRIQNPLISTAIPQKVIDALSAVAQKKRFVKRPDYADQWDKKFSNPKDWITGLLDEISGDHAWTLIPDWVTETLQRLGYDGIKDVGGKMGGNTHVVWIPFDEHQVKSAISNKNFDSSKSNIHK